MDGACLAEARNGVETPLWEEMLWQDLKQFSLLSQIYFGGV